MQPATKSTPALPTVPLARDPDGRPLEVPTDASSWLIRRLTGGRPRNLSGPDRKPLRAPTDFTESDLENMLGPGTYRLDLCDAAGKPLDVAVTVDLGEVDDARTERNASSVADVGSSLPAAASDVRLVLEANVRATQMAFQHNERTLAASLRMADTLRDGIRDLATAQAGWINTLASARGFFRNAGVAALPPARTTLETDDEEEDDDGEVEMPAGGDWKAMLEPLVGIAVERAVTTFMGMKAKAPPSSSSVEIVRPPLTLAGVLDWRKVEPKHERPVSEATEPTSAEVDKKLAEKAFAVMKHLAPAEQSRMMKLVPRAIQDPEAFQLVSNLLGMTDEAAAVWLRGHLDEIETRFS